MKDKLIALIIAAVVIELVAVIIFSILAIVGAIKITDGCLMRYSDDGNNTSSDFIQSSFSLNATGNYNNITTEEKGIVITTPDPNSYGQWKKTNITLTAGNDITLKVQGTISLCIAYLPAYNLQSDSGTDYDGKPIPIPRVEDKDPLLLYMDARLGEWRNIAKLEQNDEITVMIQNEQNPIYDQNGVVSGPVNALDFQDIFAVKNNKTPSNNRYPLSLPADCTEGHQTYSPICGRYALYSGSTNYVSNCSESTSCARKSGSGDCCWNGIFETGYYISQTGAIPGNTFQSGCSINHCYNLFDSDHHCCAGSSYLEYYEVSTGWGNVNSTAPAPYKVNGLYTMPWSNDQSKLYPPKLDYNCGSSSGRLGECGDPNDGSQRAVRNIVTGSFQHQQWFWYTAQYATGLLGRYDIPPPSEEPTNKSTIGNIGSGDSVPTDGTPVFAVIKNQVSRQVFFDTYGDGTTRYLQYRLFDAGENNPLRYTGGYVLGVKQTKCRRDNGSVLTDNNYPSRGQIQYLVLDIGQDPNENTSLSKKPINLPQVNGKNEAIISSDILKDRRSGEIWMKIDNKSEDYKDSIGQYQVQAIQVIPTGQFVADILKPLMNYKDQVLQSGKSMFKNMICYQKEGSSSCTNFFTYIRSMLTLYVILFGLMFLMGMVKITNHDIVVRVVKIALVSGLMNEGTFEFFESYVFDFVTQFSDQIISNMSGYSVFSNKELNNPLVFLDTLMTRIFFSTTFLAQLLALMALGIYGCFYFIIVFISIVVAVIAAFRAIAVYIMSFMFVAILFGLAPFFLVFLLFGKTYYLFEKWVTLTFRYMIEPAVLLCGLIILTQLFTIYLDMVVGYSVCWKCALGFKLPFPSIPGMPSAFSNIELFCINWFAPWGLDNNSISTMGMHMQNMIALMILAYCMYGYTEFSGTIVSRLTNTPNAASATGAGMAMTSAYGQAALGIVGMDAVSRHRRSEAKTQRAKENRKYVQDRLNKNKTSLFSKLKKSLLESGDSPAPRRESSFSSRFEDANNDAPSSSSSESTRRPENKSESNTDLLRIENGPSADSSEREKGAFHNRESLKKEPKSGLDDVD